MSTLATFAQTRTYYRTCASLVQTVVFLHPPLCMLPHSTRQGNGLNRVDTLNGMPEELRDSHGRAFSNPDNSIFPLNPEIDEGLALEETVSVDVSAHRFDDSFRVESLQSRFSLIMVRYPKQLCACGDCSTWHWWRRRRTISGFGDYLIWFYGRKEYGGREED